MLIRPGARPEAPIVFESGATSAIRDSQADIAKAREMLDYEPSVLLEDCLRELVVTA